MTPEIAKLVEALRNEAYWDKGEVSPIPSCIEAADLIEHLERRLKAALEYTQHTLKCDKVAFFSDHSITFDEEKPCTCGLDALLACAEALHLLHDNTAEYITINHLGDPHHNQDMQMAQAALAQLEKAP